MQQTCCEEIIRCSGIRFGTSGARGLVKHFTDSVCAAFTVAFIQSMRERYSFSHIVLGIDLRPDSPRMAAACYSAAQSLGVQVMYCGVLPTPALALQALTEQVPAIMITGSHIPFDRNGIKFYRPDGEITKCDEQAIIRNTSALPEITFGPLACANITAQQRYIERYTLMFSDQPLTGQRIGVYQHSSAGRDLNVQILTALGADVIALGRSDTFVPIDTEAVTDHDRELGRQWSQEHQLDALLTTDGDGDRPLLADEQGNWMQGDIIGLLTAQILNIQALAVPVSCNSAIEKCGAFQKVLRTRIGSPYVLAGMQQLACQYKTVAGFEANGGFLLETTIKLPKGQLAALPTRDALLPALIVLAAAARQHKPLSALQQGLPARYTASDRIAEFPNERSSALITAWQNDPKLMQDTLRLVMPITAIDATDGVRATLVKGDIIHLRASGNAPELRCYTESDTPEKAHQLLQHCLMELSRI